MFRENIMKLLIRLATLLLVISAISSCSGKNGNPSSSAISEQAPPLELEKTILGEWVAGEIYFSLPPAEILQDIKNISFLPDNIIKWSYVSDGKMQEGKGRYTLLVDSSSKANRRGLPTLFVAPEGYTYPGASSVCLLKLTDLEIDVDARFHIESIGKVLKAKDSSGKALVFVRKGKKISKQ